MISHFHFVFALAAAILVAYISFRMIVSNGQANPLPQLRQRWRNAFYDRKGGQLYFILSMKAIVGIFAAGVAYHYGWFLVSYFVMASMFFIGAGHLLAALQGFADFQIRRNCYRV